MWDSLIRPIIEEIEAKYIVEIGSESGINTKNILDYCEANDARMTAIDPLPGFDVDEFKNKYGDKFEFYQELSLSRLPLLKDYDVILIDGDHNWYTVYNELKIIEKTFKDKEFPLVFLHDVGWPYGRRDLYYNPENIPEAFRQPYKQLGMYPGQTDLKKEGGLNYFLYNSIYENNPHNGVLTAIEDFMEESDLEFSFEIVNVYHGFGILFHENNEIKNIVEEMLKSADLLDKLEEQRLNLIIENSELNKNMERLENLLNKIKIDKIEVETELKELENNNQLLRKRLKDLETEKNYIEKTFKESENTNKSLKKHLNQLEEEKNNILTLFAKSEDFNDSLEKQLKKQKNNLRNLDDENSMLKEKNRLLQNKISEKKIKFKNVKYQLNQAKNQLKLSNNLIQEKKVIISNIEKREEKIINKLKFQIDGLNAIFLELEYLNNKNRSFLQRLISKFPSLYILFKNKTNLRKTLTYIKGYNAIKKDNLFHVGYYLKNNNDIRVSGFDPLLHYIYHGFKEKRSPSPTFNSNYYIKTYGDVKNSGLNPLIHYALYGSKEGRKTYETIIKPDKQPKIFLEKKNLVNKKNNMYLGSDYNLIANSSLFNAEWYLKNNPDIKKANIDPLTHFIEYGAVEERDPHPKFSISSYLKENPDVKLSGINPLLHYVKYGEKENREIYPVLADKDKFVFELTKQKLNKKDNKRILYAIHEGGGGTPHTNKDLMTHIQNELECFILTSSGYEVKLWQYKNNNLKEVYCWSIKSKWSAKDFYNPEFRNIYFNVLSELKIDIIHIQHLVKHSFDLPEVASSLRIPIIMSFHDFYYICPSYHLLDDNHNYCAGQCTPRQEQCKVPIEELKDIANLKEFVNEWRSEAFKTLAKANDLIAPSEVVKQLYTSVYPELSEKNFKVIEHGRDFKLVNDQFYEPPSKNKPIKILIPGNINIAKGGELIKKIKEQDKDSKLEFHFIGALQTSLNLENYGIYHGTYKREDFNDLVKKIKPSFIGILSICPETYCHTLSEAWSCGIPVLTTKLGAQEERLNNNGGGWFIDHNNPLKAYNEIIRITNKPKEYKKVAEEIKKITFKSTKEMAKEYKNLYLEYYP